jgi:hypothetical protein
MLLLNSFMYNPDVSMHTLNIAVDSLFTPAKRSKLFVAGLNVGLNVAGRSFLVRHVHSRSRHQLAAPMRRDFSRIHEPNPASRSLCDCGTATSSLFFGTGSSVAPPISLTSSHPRHNERIVSDFHLTSPHLTSPHQPRLTDQSYLPRRTSDLCGLPSILHHGQPIRVRQQSIRDDI